MAKFSCWNLYWLKPSDGEIEKCHQFCDKNNHLRLFPPTNLPELLRKLNIVFSTCVIVFDRYWLFLTENVFENELICGLEVKLWAFLFSANSIKPLFLFQPIIFKCLFFDIGLVKCCVVVETIGGFFADGYYWASCHSNAFNNPPHYSHCAKPNFCFSMCRLTPWMFFIERDKMFFNQILPMTICHQKKDWELFLCLCGSIFFLEVMWISLFLWCIHVNYKLIKAAS